MADPDPGLQCHNVFYDLLFFKTHFHAERTYSIANKTGYCECTVHPGGVRAP